MVFTLKSKTKDKLEQQNVFLAQTAVLKTKSIYKQNTQ